MYSTIKPKTGICPDCKDGKEKRLMAGKCQYHYKVSRYEKKAIQKKTLDIINGNANLQRELEMDKWFRLRVSEMRGSCAECGEYINRHIYKYAKCGVAHIFPKSKFDSIRCHPLNWMELGATCGCHSRSEDFEKAMQMKIWPLMLSRIKILIGSIAKEERKSIPDIILQEIEPK
jgi:hypothetical protein